MRCGWEQLPLLKEQLLESQEKLVQAYKDLLAATEERKEREAALNEAWEALERMKEEVGRPKGQATSAEEAASKAREEAARYKGAAAELDKEKNLAKPDLASAREAYCEMKECVKREIARSIAEEAEKKAREDLEAERIRSRGLSDDVDHLKRMLLEKEGAVLQAGKMIEDLRVANTDLARSYKEIERANTDLVGENTALEERVRGEYDLAFVFLFVRFPSCVV